MISNKIVSSGDAKSIRLLLKAPVVFTNGVFDLLHAGHVVYLEQARKLGGSLIVALNSDSSVRCLGKGDDRPINNETDRAVILAALESVSVVVIFEQPTPMLILEEVKPDIYAKGGDYDVDAMDEARFVRSYGGGAVAISFNEGYSTTLLLKRIRSDN